MRKALYWIIVPLLALLLPVQATSAQDGSLDVLALEGLQRSVMRSYGLDYMAIFDAMATPGSDVPNPQGVIFLWANVLEFDSTEHAQAAMTHLADAAAKTDGITTTGAGVNPVDLALGDESIAYLETQDISGQQANAILALVRTDRTIFFVIMTAIDSPAEPALTSIVTYMIDNPAGEDAGVFNPAGTSTGGLWNRLPPVGHPLLPNLIASDAVIFPVPEGTPPA